MGIGFDTYHVFKRKIRFPMWVVFFVDLLFWLGSIALVFYVLIEVNNGVVRYPIFIGMLVGAWMYFVLGSKYYIQLLETMIKFSIWLFYTIVTTIDILIVKPIRFIFQLIWMIAIFIFSLLMSILQFLWKIVLFLTSPFARWGRNVEKSIRTKAEGFWEKCKKWINRKKQE